MSEEASLARVQSMKSEKIFLDRLASNLRDELETIQYRIKSIDLQILAEIKYAETIKTKTTACKKGKA